MIAPTLKGRVGGAQDREVPFEQVVLRGAVQKVTSTLRTVSSHHPTACRTQAYSWDRPPEQAGGGDAHLEGSRAVLWRRVLEFFSLFQ